MALVILALTLVGLMAIAALAIDIGGVSLARRNDQNAADVGALAGAIELANSDATVVAAVKRAVSGTLDGLTFSDAQWNSCGTASTSGDPDNVDTIVGGLSCITANSGSAARRLLQVRIPTQQYQTSFGRVVGLNQFGHSAFAIAGVVPAGFGSVLPYGMPASASASMQTCLKSGPTPHSEYPCDGPVSGSFGFLDFTYYGDDIVSTTQTCSGDENGRIAHNTALGIDHDLQIYGAGPTMRDDSECGNQERRANAVQENSGNRINAFGQGIYSGEDVQGPNDLAPYDARLLQPSPGISWDTPRSIDGYSLDNVPLWEFIDPIDENGVGGLDVPTSCAKSIFTDALSGTYTSLPTSPANVRAYISSLSSPAARLRALLERCLVHYSGRSWDGQGAADGVGPLQPNADPTTCASGGCTDPVFARNSSTTDAPDLYDIQYTPRFGYVPLLSTNFGSPPENPNVYHIASFRAVYIQRVFGNCPASGGCRLDFEPVVPVLGNDAPNGGGAEGMTAFQFPPSSLPNGLGGPNAPFEVGVTRFIRLVR